MKYFVKEGQKIQIAYDKPELKDGDEFVQTKENESQIPGLLEMGVIFAFDETKLDKSSAKKEEKKEEKSPAPTTDEGKKPKGAKAAV